jgi:hypothetical protein
MICIPRSKTECLYRLYDLETSECLFYCPNNSCNCQNIRTNDSPPTIIISCSCITGFKKVSDDPPACISNSCITFEKVGYKYNCITLESGYTLNALGECCVCKTGLTQVSSDPDPVICVNISICIGYTVSGGDYRCSSCALGYMIDSELKCNSCRYDYVRVSSNPFTCVLKIEHCKDYVYNGSEWICQSCNDGYTLDENLMCYKCEAGHFIFSTNPFICILEIENCVSFEGEGEDMKCRECKEGYQLSISGDCDECQTGYVKIESEGSICRKMIDRCIEYDLNTEESLCSVCESGYLIGPDGQCSICNSGYIFASLNPLVCVLEMAHCISYISTEGNLECLECESGYVLQSECVPEIDFCEKYDMYICEECQEGYELKSDQTCGYLDSICDKGNYLAANNRCNKCPQYCLECKPNDDDQIACLVCESDYELLEKKCVLEANTTVITDSNTLVQGATRAAQVSSITSIASISVSFVSLNFNSILSMIGTIQIISYTLLYNITIPSRAKSMLEGITILKILPNIFEYFIPKVDNINIERYKRADINNELFLINAGKIITMLILMILVIIILKLISRLIHISIMSTSIERILNMLEWNLVIGYLIQATLEFTIFSLVNIYNVSYSSTHSIVGFCISIFVLV